jgi:hypothetical protein
MKFEIVIVSTFKSPTCKVQTRVGKILKMAPNPLGYGDGFES